MNEPKEGFELDPIEDARDTIDKVFALFAEGIDLDKRTGLRAEGPLSVLLYVEDDTLVVSLDEPYPRVKYSFFSGELKAVRITREAIDVELGGLPDVTIEVLS